MKITMFATTVKIIALAFVFHPQDVIAQTQCFTGTVSEVQASCDALSSNNCCTGTCIWDSSMDDNIEICEGSCIGGNTCVFTNTNADKIYIKENSCTSGVSCDGLGDNSPDGTEITIGPNACTAYSSCRHVTGSVGEDSCVASYSCFNVDGNIGENSCRVPNTCRNAVGDIGDDSCNSGGACQSAGLTKIGSVGASFCGTSHKTIGDNSCNSQFACDYAAKVADNTASCDEDAICGF